MEKSKLLVTQALDEKALLVKKIQSKIENARFVDAKKVNEEKAYFSKEKEEEFKQSAMSSYQQIMDLIDRYQKLDAAIIVSNAQTQIETSYGTMSVAAAISLRNRLRCSNSSGNLVLSNNCLTTQKVPEDEFERLLENKMYRDYTECNNTMESKNGNLQNTAENMRLTILGKDNKGKEDRPLEVVEAYVKENSVELVDPLSVLKKIEEIKLKRSTLLAELETMIKISNATTFIEV